MNNLRKEPIISASVLSINFARFAQQLEIIEDTNIDWLHFDVMDGIFVPAITFGPKLIKDCRKYSKKIFDVHLMIQNADLYIKEFAEAGADIITIHSEACNHLDRTIDLVKSTGAKVGLALNPSTNENILEYVLEKLDLVLVMSVNPGFAGQKFIESQLNKIENIKKMIISKNLSTKISVDGGVNEETAKKILASGADILVSGNYLFTGELESNLKKLKQLV